MAAFYFFVIFCCWAQLSRGAAYKLCATANHENHCRVMETSSNVTCVKVSDSVDCLLKMQKKQADLGVFYPEEAFLAARFLGDDGVVLAEVRHPDRQDRPFGFETVAVVRRTLLGGLSALAGMSYCHPGFGKGQYWSDRVLKDFEWGVLEHFKDDVKCNSAKLSAYEDDLHRLSKIFRKACRPGVWSLSDWWDKKLKRDYHALCEQCEHPATCSYDVRNRGRHSDALRCLTRHGGNVTYTALEFVREYFDDEDGGLAPPHKDPSRYHFLCRDGSTMPLVAEEPCSWIKQPWTAVVALSAESEKLQEDLKGWLDTEKSSAWSSSLRGVLGKGDGVLKFRDHPIKVSDYIGAGRSIPTAETGSCHERVRWCTVGKQEQKKCEFISSAALTHGLPVGVACVQGGSKIDCLGKIAALEADVVYVDSDLGYTARKTYNLTPAAYLETELSGNYYGVIVVRGNSIKKLKDLRGKRACFPQYNGLGWLTYVEVLKYLSEIPKRSCPNVKKTFSFFSEVCAPGAKDPRMNFSRTKVLDQMCKACAKGGASCDANTRNPYYGEIGALRCLSKGADVAFLDYNALQKLSASAENNSDIKWNDLKILCKGDTLESLNATDLNRCFFTQLAAGEMVMRRDLERVQEMDVRHTLVELDDLFGTTSRAYNPAIRMFEAFDGETGVLFKESAVSLVSVYETQNRFVRNYADLLKSFEGCHGDSSSNVLLPSAFAVAFFVFFVFYQQ